MSVESKDTDEKRRRKRQRVRQRIRQRIVEIKSQPCQDCGAIYVGEASGLMTFDHLPSREKKRFNVGRATTFKSLERELAKCRLICRDCHDAQEFLRNRSQIGKSRRISVLASLLLLVGGADSTSESLQNSESPLQ